MAYYTEGLPTVRTGGTTGGEVQTEVQNMKKIIFLQIIEIEKWSRARWKRIHEKSPTK